MAVTWPRGIRSSGVACGIKTGGALDLGLLVLDEPSAWAGTFTKNGAAAACVDWSRSLLGSPLRAIVVNSGNANACTGAQGEQAVKTTVETVAANLGCDAREIAVASTGPIGVPLPVDKIVATTGLAVDGLVPSPHSLAEAIMTTDTQVKIATGSMDGCTIVGVAKGAAMLAPNMATMLAFVATDASFDTLALQPALNRAVKTSFDRISVDACESTNDSVFLVTSGRGPIISEDRFTDALTGVCRSLAEQMVRDAEGASKFVRIQIAGAEDEDTAVALGRSVAASALWRAALHGADPNWGRVLAALGAVDRKLDLDSVRLTIGDHVVFGNGMPAGNLAEAATVMRSDEFTVSCMVGRTGVSVEVLTTDLSPDYVVLNAGGMS